MRIKATFLTMISILMTIAITTAVQARTVKNVASSWHHKTLSQTPVGQPGATRPVIVFGHEGGNLRPYKIAIYADGQVKALDGNPSLKTDRIPKEKVRELVNRARDKNFWKAAAGSENSDNQRPLLPDFGSVYVKVRASDGSRRYHNHSGQQTGPLAQIYKELSDLVLAQP